MNDDLRCLTCGRKPHPKGRYYVRAYHWDPKGPVYELDIVFQCTIHKPYSGISFKTLDEAKENIIIRRLQNEE